MPSARPVKEIFADALELPASERAEFLERECAGDAEIRSRVEQLLSAHAGGEKFLAQSDAAPLHEVPGVRIGPYRLLEKLGEGGFGVVFLAEQTEPLVRRVALKVIKLGMDTRQVIARFEAERQALAMMDHPNIAKVLDAGATASGRPYFVMELVRGRPITEFCDEHHLDTSARLELFQQVCHAVQHAHQKGIIHRDLKPGNVLVAMQDGAPMPKVIDFGIAKATVARLTEKTLFTQHRAWIGTPEYMSPEQAGLAGSDVDTRSDVYSLGVLLYELLTGTTPFRASELREGAFEEVERIIREVEPPKPSARISTMSDAIVSVAAHRRTEPARLAKLVRGDLDWIVMKCIEKDRSRRYETANGLAQDVLRHLRGEPVLAAPPSTTYRVRKFVRLHRVGVAAGAATAIALVLGMAGTTSGLAWALREQERSEESAQKAKDAADLAKRTAGQARSVTEFLSGLIALTNADVSQRPDLTVRELLDRAATQVGDVFRDDPESEARVRTVIGQAYDMHGEPTLAVIHLERALELRDGPTGGTPEQLYEILYTYMYAARDATFGAGFVPRGGNYRVAIGCQRVIAEAHPELGEPCMLVIHTIVKGPAHAASLLENLEEMLRLARMEIPPGDPTWIYVADFCVGTAEMLARSDEERAVIPSREALAIYRRMLPETHTRIVKCMDELVGYLEGAGRHSEFEATARQALDLTEHRLPEDHWYVAWCRARLGTSLLRQGRLDEADPLLTAALPALERAQPTSPRTLRTEMALVELHERSGRRRQADEQRAKVVDHVARSTRFDDSVTADVLLGPDLADLAASFRTTVDALEGNRADAGASFAAFVALRRSSFPDSDPRAAALANLLYDPAEAYANRTSELEVALHVFRDFADLSVGSVIPASQRVVGLWWCSDLCEQLGRYSEGEAFAREGLRDAQGRLGPDDWSVANLRRILGSNLVGLGREEEGLRMLVSGYEGLASTMGFADGNTFYAFQALMRLHGARGRTREASALGKRHIERLLAGAADPSNLADSTWEVVVLPGLERETYAVALDAATRVVASRGDLPGDVNTVGVGQYRLDRFEEALGTLQRSAELAEKRPAGASIFDHAFLAMVHERLGHPAEASAALARARELARIPAQGAAAAKDGFLREAEAVVEGR